MLPVYGEICQRMGGTKVKPFFAWGGEVWLWLEENLCLYIFKCFFMVIYPSHGYTALVEDEICKKYQAVLAS